MKILYHHRTQGKGVEGIHICSIAKALGELGHTVTIVSPPGCDPSSQAKSETRQQQRMIRNVFSLISKRFPEIVFEILELLYNLNSYLKISAIIRREEIVLIYERYFLFSLASSLLAKKFNIPIIYEVNDSSFVPRLRHLRLVKLANYCERKVFQNARAIITVSYYFKKQLVAAGIPEAKIVVAHNAVDPDLFDPAKVQQVPLAIPSDRVVLGFVGLFVEWVGLDTLLQIYLSIVKKYLKIHLLLVGTGPLEEHLRRVIDDYGVQNNVTITGRVPHDLVPSYIHRMDICIIPKHERYTSPVKLFEYMAMGKAVLAPAYESIQEIITDGKNGLLFNPDDSQHISYRIQELLENRELMQSIGGRARREVLSRYTWRNNAIQIEELAGFPC